MELQHRLRDAASSAVPMRYRRRLARSRVRLRQPSAALRALPDFFVLGTERGGTSSLYKYLQRHPYIRSSIRKEVEYFDRYPHLGLNWYRAHFPIERLMGSSCVFEGTPSYMVHPRVPEKVAALLPEARFVVLLRDPVARALSGWRHYLDLGFEALSFEQAVDEEPERIAGELDRMVQNPDYFSKPYLHFGYLHKGRYAEQLGRWFDHFPRERFFIAESESLYADPDAFVRRLSTFLEVPSWGPGNIERFGSPTSSNPARARSELPDELLGRLVDYFEAPNQHLSDLLGSEFSWT